MAQIFNDIVLKNNKNKFGPVTLASCLFKLIERMILLRLMHLLEMTDLIPSSQNCLRKFESCTISLATLETEVLRAFSAEHCLLSSST